MIAPYYQDEHCTIYHGDCREVVPQLEQCFDLVLTDPPYSSGGMMRSDRNQAVNVMYQTTDTMKQYANFSGDSRDQRSFLLWCDLWLRDCLARVNPSGVVASFIDWRQLPTMIDAMQVAGWVYRGLLVWDKTEASRPQKGWFRAQAEYIVLGSNGALDVDREGVSSPGVFRHYVKPGTKQHITAKPIALILDILKTSPKFQTVLDPFMGSGTTLEAAKKMGIHAVGIEIEERYCEITAARLRQEVLL